MWPGQYDECVNINAMANDTTNHKEVQVQGRYFRLLLSVKMPQGIIAALVRIAL